MQIQQLTLNIDRRRKLIADEYLNYAKNNRKEWMAKGQALVEEMVQKYRQQSLRRNTIA